MKLLAILTLFGAAAVTLVSCVTRYKLSTKDNPQKKPIGQVSEGYVDVTFTQQKCLSGKFESVPVKLVGVVNESGLPRKDFNSFTFHAIQQNGWGKG